MTPIVIPKALLEIAGRDASVSGVVQSSAHKFQEWVGNNSMRFFPEYTRHDVGHISEVIATCVEIMSKDAVDVLTPNDVLVLVLSCFLHDSAMYFNEDTFLELVGSDGRLQGVIGLDKDQWPDLWEEFLSEAARFDGKKLQTLFGDTLPARRPPRDPRDFTERDRRLVGEFIRRHHTQLAHQIAIQGMPIFGGGYYDLAPNCARHLRDLAGLVARSHGTELRNLFPYLDSKYHLREFDGVHAIYLMGVLRIADYLQLQADRAPVAVTEMQRLKSPLSANEWRVHQSVQNITRAVPDPEALFVQAQPKDSRSYLRLRAWIADLQFELDRTWAVLGEVYGRYREQGLTNLSMTVRRIQSNLDDVSKFSSTVDYIPRRFQFGTDEGGLLKLLIGPLYNHQVEVGVRELVQNATDSCREMNDLVVRGKVPSDLVNAGLDADVVVDIWCNDQGIPISITVSDRGTGMSSEVVANYFLKAGASFRASDAWKKEFETGEGASRIARTGRFGVGALAAYLLGPRARVTTRHYTAQANEALKFEAGVDDDQIEVTRTAAPVGTRIEIDLSARAGKELHKIFADEHQRLQFYCLAWPRVLIRYQPKGHTVLAPFIVPDSGDKEKSPWNFLKQGQYESVHWTYDVRRSFICNGIVVDRWFGQRHWFREAGHRFETPAVSIFDFSGKAPINLQRNSVDESDLGINEELERDIEIDFAVYHAFFPPLRPAPVKTGTWLTTSVSDYVGVDMHSTSYGSWVFARGGLQLLRPEIARALAQRRLIVAPASDVSVGQRMINKLSDGELLLFNGATMASYAFSALVRASSTDNLGGHDYWNPKRNLERALGWGLRMERIYLHEKLVERLTNLKATTKGERAWLGRLVRVGQSGGWLRDAMSAEAPKKTDLEILAAISKDAAFLAKRGAVFSVERTTSPEKKLSKRSQATSAWVRIFGAEILPPDAGVWQRAREKAAKLYPIVARRHAGRSESVPHDD